MFSVTVRDHVMVAHSLSGAVFGPAHRLHGATFLVDATAGALGEGARGLDAIAVTLHESHVAWASYERAL